MLSLQIFTHTFPVIIQYKSTSHLSPSKYRWIVGEGKNGANHEQSISTPPTRPAQESNRSRNQYLRNSKTPIPFRAEDGGDDSQPVVANNHSKQLKDTAAAMQLAAQLVAAKSAMYSGHQTRDDALQPDLEEVRRSCIAQREKQEKEVESAERVSTTHGQELLDQLNDREEFIEVNSTNTNGDSVKQASVRKDSLLGLPAETDRVQADEKIYHEDVRKLLCVDKRLTGSQNNAFEVMVQGMQESAATTLINLSLPPPPPKRKL
ncbi:unnamed protein product [Protopolystoma xenopodis]|uniref:Uncharacterized protein n=1 Tax=Protopolystoma xenopodis TaxID=117903 RepID=A0A448WU32_9PLAT|nr:unnamed protein product [Protopolystoma xenopodis]